MRFLKRFFPLNCVTTPLFSASSFGSVLYQHRTVAFVIHATEVVVFWVYFNSCLSPSYTFSPFVLTHVLVNKVSYSPVDGNSGNRYRSPSTPPHQHPVKISVTQSSGNCYLELVTQVGKW